jgi:beta-lactamase class A
VWEPRRVGVEAEIAAIFGAVGARGFLHACEIGPSDVGGAMINVDGDCQVAAASVIKIVFAVAYARAATVGEIDPSERIEVPRELRVGGSGTAGFADTPLVSLRDLASLMITVSDNAASDLIYQRVGPAAVSAVLDDLGLNDTHIRSDMSSAGRRVAAELGLADAHNLDAQLATVDVDRVRALAWLDPQQANATTAIDMTTLLHAIWTDRAGPPKCCAFVRDAMSRRENTQRLASGFDGVIGVAGKTGTLPFVRNEAGVVSYPDGRRYAIAIFTQTQSPLPRDAGVDTAIGQAARVAVEALRNA